MCRSFWLSTLIFQHSKSGSLYSYREQGLLFQVDWSRLSLWTGFTKELPPPQPQDFWWITVGRGLGSSNCWPNNLLDEVHEMICLSVSQQLWLYHHYSPLLCLYLTFLWLYLIRNNSDCPAAPSPRLHRSRININNYCRIILKIYKHWPLDDDQWQWLVWVWSNEMNYTPYLTLDD